MAPMRVTFVVKGLNRMIHEGMFWERGMGMDVKKINETKTELVYETTDANLEHLMQWFCEQPALIEGYGYPDGTLLFYSIHDTVEGA